MSHWVLFRNRFKNSFFKTLYITVALTYIPSGLTVRLNSAVMSEGVPVTVILDVGTNVIDVDLIPSGGATVNCVLRIIRAPAPDVQDPLELTEFYYSFDLSMGYVKQTQTDTTFNLIDNDGVQIDYGSILEYDNENNLIVVYSDVVFNDGGDPFYNCLWSEPGADGIFTLAYSDGCASLEEARTTLPDDIVVFAYKNTNKIPPILLLNGEDTMEYIDSDSFTDPGATVKDWPEDTVVYADITALDSGAGGTEILTYDFTDGDGNPAVQVSRTVFLPLVLFGDISQSMPGDVSEIITPYSGMSGETFHLATFFYSDDLADNRGTGASLDFAAGIPDLQSISNFLELEELTYSDSEAEVLIAQVIRRDSFGEATGFVLDGDVSGYATPQLIFYYYYYSTADTLINGTGEYTGWNYDNLQLAAGWNKVRVELDESGYTISNGTISGSVLTLGETPVQPEISDMYMYEATFNNCYVHFAVEDIDVWTVVQEDGGSAVDQGNILRCDNAANEMVFYSDVQECYIKMTWTDPYPVTSKGSYTYYSGYDTFSEAFNASGGEVLDFYTDPDLVPPVIILNGANPDNIPLSLGGTYTDPGATTKDWDEDDVPIQADEPWGWDTSSSGTYELFYNYEDSDGNHAEEVIREVIVEESAE